MFFFHYFLFIIIFYSSRTWLAVTNGFIVRTNYASARKSFVDLRTRTRLAASEFRMTVETVSANIAVRANRVFLAVLQRNRVLYNIYSCIFT